MLLKTSRWIACLAALALVPTAAQAQMFFEADFVALKLNNGDSQPFISGPDSFSSPGSFDFQPGFRLTLGGSLGDYEVYTSYIQVNPWSASGQITLGNPLVLDENAASPFVAPANTLAFTNLLYDAASLADMDPAANEANEIELLQAGATARYRTRTTYSDFELNVGTSRNISPWRAAIGYRNILLKGDGSFAVSGIFDAIDVATGAQPTDAGNEPNDGLAATSFTSVGFTQTAGGGGFDAVAAGGPDTMTILSSGQAHNELNGAQATVAYRTLNGEWLQVEAFGKAGIYNNRIRGAVSEVITGTGNADTQFTRAFSSRKRSAAFGGSLGARAIVPMTDYINLVGGYEVLLLTGVGVADDQTNGLGRDFLGNMTYNITTSSIFIHGANVGLEVLW